MLRISKFSTFVLSLFMLQACGEAVQTKKVEVLEPGSEGAKVFVKYCSDCHAPPKPSVHVAQEWPNVVYRMQERRRMKAYSLMSSEEVAVLTSYLQKYAKVE